MATERIKEFDITPDYQQFFELAVQLTKSGVPEDQGQDLIVEMLKYGQRMDKLAQEDGDYNRNFTSIKEGK